MIRTFVAKPETLIVVLHLLRSLLHVVMIEVMTMAMVTIMIITLEFNAKSRTSLAIQLVSVANGL